MRIVQANAVYDPAFTTPDDLLDAYHSLTEWSVAMSEAGAQVSVVQRFRSNSTLVRDGITYQFVADRDAPWLSATAAPRPFVDAIAARAADSVHVNGLIFPNLVSAIRTSVGPSPAIVVQHHGGEFPVRAPGWLGAWQRRQWRKGLEAASALSFTAQTQAAAWHDAGVIGSQPILEIIEASTTLRPSPRDRAQQLTGVNADPLILWVGRLTTNKDPLAVLEGFERALTTLPRAQLVMIFGDDTLREAVEQRRASSPRLQSTVALIGRVEHHELAHYYGAADLFVSGSHYEGSGYALIEAMAAGVTPVVTDIPSFRVIAGTSAHYWPVGDPAALEHALVAAARGDREQQRAATLRQFDTQVSWKAIAARTMTAYQALLRTRTATP